MSADRWTRPDGSNPDGYYRAFAARYVALLPTTARPAATLAAEAQVPVTTVHRWVREARARGFLPPGRKGAAQSTSPLQRVADALGIDPETLRRAIAQHANGRLVVSRGSGHGGMA